MKMKRLLSMVLCVVLLGCVLAAAANAEGIKYVYTQNGKTLNLRQNPDLNANKITQIPFGAQVYEEAMLGVPDGWSCVTYNGLRGFVVNRYLVDSPRPNPAPGGGGSTEEPVDIAALFKSFKQVTPYSAIAAPNGAYVNLRWAPTQSAPAFARLVYGHPLTVIDVGSSWLHVIDDSTGAVGFIMKKYVK